MAAISMYVHKIFMYFGLCFGDMQAERQTCAHTDSLIAILRTPSDVKFTNHSSTYIHRVPKRETPNSWP